MALLFFSMKKLIIFLFIYFFSVFVFADDKMKLGLEIYNNKAQCGTCHILNAAKSEGQIGPNLDQLKPQLSQIVMAVTNGVGVMPAWDGVLSTEEIEAVSYFVFESTSN